MHFTFGALGAMLILTNCLRKSFVLQLPQHQWNAASAMWITVNLRIEAQGFYQYNLP